MKTPNSTTAADRPIAVPQWIWRLRNLWFGLWVLLAALVAGLVYWPSLRSPFVFDDLYLPFAYPDAAGRSLPSWLAGVRPVLMFSYWLNYRLGGLQTSSYHALNLALHVVCACLVYVILHTVLEWDGHAEARPLALAGAAIFLLHPVQTEAVAYVAGRSDVLSTAFCYGALALYARTGRGRMAASRTASIVLLIILACLSKENSVVMPLVLLITDIYWDKTRIRDHKHFYGSLAALTAAVGVFLAYRVLPGAQAAGFRLTGLSPIQYFYTECRAIWVYLRLFAVPVNLNADYDFPISHTIFEYRAATGFAGLVLLLALAIVFRKRYKLVSFGFVLFLLFISPTSSVLPILDPVAERRLYLPSIGLLMVAAGIAGPVFRVKRLHRLAPAVLLVLLISLGSMTYGRNRVWSSPIALWIDTTAKSPGKYRPRFQLAFAEYQAGKCGEASTQYAIAAHIGPRDNRLLIDWALADDCAGNPEAAIGELKEAVTLFPTAQAYSQIGLIRARQGLYPEALQFFQKAEATDSTFGLTYVYRGMAYARTGDLSRAAADFRKALAVNPRDQTAAAALQLVESAQSRPKPH